MVKKTLIGSLPIMDRWQKTSFRLMLMRRKKSYAIGSILLVKTRFLPMINTIGKTSKKF
jgi:hypothetical protein